MSPGAQKKGPVRPFQMPIDDVAVITGRGTVVTGRIRQGAVTVGDPVTITGPGGTSAASVVTGVQISGRAVGGARAGDTVGVLLRGLPARDVAPGHVLQAG